MKRIKRGLVNETILLSHSIETEEKLFFKKIEHLFHICVRLMNVCRGPRDTDFIPRPRAI